jgi:hypothetical protein
MGLAQPPPSIQPPVGTSSAASTQRPTHLCDVKLVARDGRLALVEAGPTAVDGQRVAERHL